MLMSPFTKLFFYPPPSLPRFTLDLRDDTSSRGVGKDFNFPLFSAPFHSTATFRTIEVFWSCPPEKLRRFFRCQCAFDPFPSARPFRFPHPSSRLNISPPFSLSLPLNPPPPSPPLVYYPTGRGVAPLRFGLEIRNSSRPPPPAYVDRARIEYPRHPPPVHAYVPSSFRPHRVSLCHHLFIDP